MNRDAGSSDVDAELEAVESGAQARLVKDRKTDAVDGTIRLILVQTLIQVIQRSKIIDISSVMMIDSAFAVVCI